MIKFYPSVLNGTVTAPPSKACGLRMMFAASLAAKATTIENLPDCKDIKTAAECLTELGCKISFKGSERLTAVIEPFSKTSSLRQLNFNFRESATTARFITVFASAYGFPANCQAEGTLLKRSQVSMTGRMAVRGAVFSSFSYPLSINGRLTGGDFLLKGDEGSQFISALIMALPVLREDSRIILESPLIDTSFVQITIDILEKFGIKIEKTENGYYIPGQQYYKSPKKLSCENDWGLASMWTAAGCMNTEANSFVTVSGLSKESSQMYRDAASVFPLLSQDFENFNVDASSFPNLTTLFAAIAAVRGASITITGVPQLRYKETNRLRAIGQCMANLGVTSRELEDGISISGSKDADYPENIVIDDYGDPWLFMSLALASTACKKPICLKDEHCAEKIYGNFLKDYQSLGGKYEIL